MKRLNRCRGWAVRIDKEAMIDEETYENKQDGFVFKMHIGDETYLFDDNGFYMLYTVFKKTNFWIEESLREDNENSL
jgi:hypothetical protein